MKKEPLFTKQSGLSGSNVIASEAWRSSPSVIDGLSNRLNQTEPLDGFASLAMTSRRFGRAV